MAKIKSDTPNKHTFFAKIVLQNRYLVLFVLSEYLLLHCGLVMFSVGDWKKSVWSTKRKYILRNKYFSYRQFHRHSRLLVCNTSFSSTLKLLAKISGQTFLENLGKKPNWCKIKVPTYVLVRLEWRTCNPTVVYFSSLITLVWMIFLCLDLLGGRADLRKWRQKVWYGFYILYNCVRILRFSSVSHNTVLPF